MPRDPVMYRLRLDPLFTQEAPPPEILEAVAKVFGPSAADPDAWRRGPGPMIVELDMAHALDVIRVVIDQVVANAKAPPA